MSIAELEQLETQTDEEITKTEQEIEQLEESRRKEVLARVQEKLRILEVKRKERDRLLATKNGHLMEENEEMLE